MLISLNKPPCHGLAQVTLPVDCFCRHVSLSGRPVKSQFVDAPYPNQYSSGRLLLELPEPADQIELETTDVAEGNIPLPSVETQPAVQIRDNRLYIRHGNHDLVFNDYIDNEKLDNTEAVEGDKGIFSLFNSQSQITLLSAGPLAKVYRIRTPLEDEASEAQASVIARCTAFYDFVLYADHPLVEVTGCFNGHSPTRA